MTVSIAISLIGVAITIGGVLIAAGMFKQKISDNTEVNKAHEAHLKTLASKTELAQAIQRSDELLELMQQRVSEDRAAGEKKYTELYSLLNVHSERIGKLEVSQAQVFKMLDKLDSTINNGFKDMKDDIRELRKEIQKG